MTWRRRDLVRKAQERAQWLDAMHVLAFGAHVRGGFMAISLDGLAPISVTGKDPR